ncbi:MAG: zinc-ribbon domain-containing protein [Myxococcaceae bacterium]|nr:zinc-ribbon domain-containing protein [Myxococcaceae bacterium]
MRIVCQSCGTAYAIEDRVVTEKGVRAQCPRCRHLQTVKKGDDGQGRSADPGPSATDASSELEARLHETMPFPGPPPAGQAVASPFDLPAPGGGAGPTAQPRAPDVVASPFDFDLLSLPAPSGAGSSLPAARPSSTERFGAYSFTGAAPAPAAPAPPRSAPLPAPTTQQFGSFEGQAPARAPGPDPFAELGLGAELPTMPGGMPPLPPSGGGARPALAPPAPSLGFDDFPISPSLPSPTAPPVDPFAAPPPALGGGFGVSPVASAPPEGPGAGPGVAVAPTASRCRTCGKPIADPFDVALGTCDDCRGKDQAWVEAPTDGKGARQEHFEAPSGGSAPASAALHTALPAPARGTSAAPSSAAGANLAGPRAVRSASRATGPAGRGRLVAGAALGLVFLGGVGGFLAWKRPWVRRPPRAVMAAAPVSSSAVDAVVEGWKFKYADLADESARDAQKYLEAGSAALDRDTESGYREAEEAFERALVLDSSLDQAIAGWALALAFGRPGEVDEPTSKAADALLTAAEKRSGAPAVYAAHAHLDLARGRNPNDVEVRANVARSGGEARDKALAALALGQVRLSKNPLVAEQLLRDALDLDPKLKRALTLMAQLAVSVGKYKEAAGLLEKRLALDSAQWEASELLARLHLEVGDAGQAKKVLEGAVKADPRNLRARTTLAALAYQHQGDAAAALELLRGVVSAPDAPSRERAEALAHRAAAHRQQGELERSMEAAKAALELVPAHVGARVQLVLTAIDAGVLSQARLTLESLQSELPRPLYQQLDGRLLFAEGRHAEALATLQQLADQDPSQAGALLLAGAAAAKARKDGKAWELCLKRGLQLDPQSNPVPPLSRIFVSQRELLAPAGGAWAALTTGADEDPNPHLCEGLVAWFSGDLATADRHLARVIAIDPRNADGFAYRSLIALRKGDLGSALTMAGRGVGASRGHALANYALAAAQMAANRVDAAKAAATTANKARPALLAPRVILGDAEARQQGLDAARRLLTGVLLTDSNYLAAKRVLFTHSL